MLPLSFYDTTTVPATPRQRARKRDVLAHPALTVGRWYAVVEPPVILGARCRAIPGSVWLACAPRPQHFPLAGLELAPGAPP